MKYENFVEWCIIICVVVGAILAIVGLWCGNIPTFCAGLVVGGLLPILVASIYTDMEYRWSSRNHYPTDAR